MSRGTALLLLQVVLQTSAYEWFELFVWAARTPFTRVVDDALVNPNVNVRRRFNEDQLLMQVAIDNLESRMRLVMLRQLSSRRKRNSKQFHECFKWSDIVLHTQFGLSEISGYGETCNERLVQDGRHTVGIFFIQLIILLMVSGQNNF